MVYDPLNGTSLINDPFGQIWGVFTDFIDKILPGSNNGTVFFLIPIMVLAVGLRIKNPEKPILATVFIVGSCALLSSGSLFVGAYGASAIFILIFGITMAKLVVDTVFHRGV